MIYYQICDNIANNELYACKQMTIYVYQYNYACITNTMDITQ